MFCKKKRETKMAISYEEMKKSKKLDSFFAEEKEE